MYYYVIHTGENRTYRGHGLSFEQVLKNKFGKHVDIKSLYPIRAFIRTPLTPPTKEDRESE